MKLTSLLFVFILLRISLSNSDFPAPATNYFNSLLPSDAVALLSFKSAADLDNKLFYSLTERYDYCQWHGVKCAQGRVVRLVLAGVGLRGYFSRDTLSLLDQLRVLSLENNTLIGPVPDLSPLVNLKSLFLGRNEFSGTFPSSIFSLHRLEVLDLSHNNFTGPIASDINSLDHLTSLNLKMNKFNGALPPLNQSRLTSFNVSGNKLTGPLPVTQTLSRFDSSAFGFNPGLCGEIIHRACASHSPFFASSNVSSSPAPLRQTPQGQNDGAIVSPAVGPKRNGGGLVFGFTMGVAALIVIGLGVIVFSLMMKKQRDEDDEVFQVNPKGETSAQVRMHHSSTESVPMSNSHLETQKISKKTEDKLEAVDPLNQIPRSGNLVFCGKESGQGMYTLKELMRASAELLGRGSVGTTYKAVLDSQLIVTVKRLDAGKTAMTSDKAFGRHMDIVGGLRHPNLVPMRAYFQSMGERLVVYDYQPNGSLLNLIQGSRSSRSKPLHWTSCLKIAEDVAQGLNHIHETSGLIHGNLKSTNILLGQDFEACITDYCLTVLTDRCTVTAAEDPDAACYRAPEIRKSNGRRTSKCDVYSLGVFILELLTGKSPARHPFMAPGDMVEWVRAMREEEGEVTSQDNGLGMLTEVACVCRVTSPEQRPTTRHVIEMIQEIKESVVVVNKDPFQHS